MADKEKPIRERIQDYINSTSGDIQLSTMANALGVTRERMRQLRADIEKILPEGRRILSRREITAGRNRKKARRKMEETNAAIAPYLHDESRSQREIAEKIGRNPSTVSQAMRRLGVSRRGTREHVERTQATMKKNGIRPGRRKQTPEQIALRVKHRRETLEKQGRKK